MRYYVIGLMVMAACWLPGNQPHAEAQVQRDRFVVVTAQELGENPQRYWSRGIVFEDEFTRVTGRGKRVNGRRLVQIETATLGPCYVDDRIIDRVSDLTERKNYLFAGTVLSESRRRPPFFRPRSHYFVTIDAVEKLADDIEDDLLKAFKDAEPDRAAFQNVHKAMVQAQNQLVAFAQAEGVEIAKLFDPAGATMDKAAEVSRVAVRTVEQELGITSIEMLSLLVRELLAAQYVGVAESPVAPEVPEPEDAEPDREGLETEEADEEGPSDSAAEASIDEEPPSQGRRFWRSRGAEGEEEGKDVESDFEPVLEDPAEEEQPSARRGFFRRRAAETESEEVVEQEPVLVVEEVVEAPDDAASRSRFRLFRRDRAESDAEVVTEAESAAEGIEAVEPAPVARPAPEPSPDHEASQTRVRR